MLGPDFGSIRSFAPSKLSCKDCECLKTPVSKERQEYQSNLLEKRYPMSIQSANPAFYHLPSLIGDVSIVAARNLKMATALHLAAEGGLEV